MAAPGTPRSTPTAGTCWGRTAAPRRTATGRRGRSRRLRGRIPRCKSTYTRARATSAPAGGGTPTCSRPLGLPPAPTVSLPYLNIVSKEQAVANLEAARQQRRPAPRVPLRHRAAIARGARRVGAGGARAGAVRRVGVKARILARRGARRRRPDGVRGRLAARHVPRRGRHTKARQRRCTRRH